MAFRDGPIATLCQLCKAAGASPCERCSRPVCPKHHGPDRCKVCEDEFEAAQTARDEDVEHLFAIRRQNRHNAPAHVRRYHNVTGFTGLAMMIVPAIVGMFFWRNDMRGMILLGGGFAVFMLYLKLVGPMLYRRKNRRELHRRIFLAERAPALLKEEPGWRRELADATTFSGLEVEERFRLFQDDRVQSCYPDEATRVYVLEGDHRFGSWQQTHPQCVVVTGSLVVDGPIDLRMPEPGGFLAVLGDLQATSADVGNLEGHASLYVGGSMYTTGCVLVGYSGYLNVTGDLRCPALVPLDHSLTRVDGELIGQEVDCDIGTDKEPSHFFDASVLDEDGELLDEDRIESGELSSVELTAALLPRVAS